MQTRQTISPALRTIFDNFVRDAAVHGQSPNRILENTDFYLEETTQAEADQRFSLLDGSRHAPGYCTVADAGSKTQRTRTVRLVAGVDKDPLQRVSIYHEFGHCLLDLEHVEGKASIMNSVHDSATLAYLNANWDEALRDFFAQSRRK